MKKLMVSSLALALIVNILAGCGNSDSAAPSSGTTGNTAETSKPPAQKQVWKVSLMGSETHPATQGFAIFKEELEKRVGDLVEVQLFPNGQLGTSPDQTISGMQNGIVQFSDIALGNVAEFSKAFVPVDVPYLFLDRDTAFEVMDGEAGKKMAERYEEDTGVKLLGVFDYGFRVVTNSRRAIAQPADMKGLKIRTLSNPIHMEAFKAFGANPTTMAYSELFTGMQQGTIDGQENPVSTIWDAKFYEVQQYLSLTDHVYGFLGMHMSAELYNQQTDEVKKEVDEAAAIAVEKQREICKQANEEALQHIRDSGKTEINELTEEQKLQFRQLTESAKEAAAETAGADYMQMVTDEVSKLEASK